jgi:hypothetical protein
VRRVCRVRCFGAALLMVLAPTSLAAQRGVLSGVIVSGETKERLAYSIVALPALGREIFTSDSGAFTFADLPLGPQLLKVRRLGYTPADITINVGTAPDTVRVALARIATRLGAVTVRAYPACTNPGPPATVENADSALTVVFSQLRMNADQLRLLSDEYPFVSQIENSRFHKTTKGDIEFEQKISFLLQSNRLWRYRPGKVVTGHGHYIFNIPTLVHFADPRFVAEHCFHYAGVDTVDDVPVVRLDLVASQRLKEPDVDGSLYLDQETFQIRRSTLRLTRMPNVRALRSFDVTTDFAELMESIPVIRRVFTIQRFDTTVKSREYDEVYEDVKLAGITFIGKKPGQERKSP